MDHIWQTIRGAAGIAGLAVAGVVGYTNLDHQVKDNTRTLEHHSTYIQEDLDATSRVDERTKLMKEQLDRIEQKVSR